MSAQIRRSADKWRPNALTTYGGTGCSADCSILWLEVTTVRYAPDEYGEALLSTEGLRA